MTQQKPTSAPTECAAQEEELFENLRGAAWMFEKEEDGRFLGSIAACHAVVRFIHQRNRGVELAGPFIRIAEAFEDRKKGGSPHLFSKKIVANKERSRSPERKHIQRLAAAFLEVLVELGERVDSAAKKVAQAVNDWPGMSEQTVTGKTVIAWRKQLRSDGDQKFRILVRETLKEADPGGTIKKWLQKGPPGLWQG